MRAAKRSGRSSSAPTAWPAGAHNAPEQTEGTPGAQIPKRSQSRCARMGKITTMPVQFHQMESIHYTLVERKGGHGNS